MTTDSYGGVAVHDPRPLFLSSSNSNSSMPLSVDQSNIETSTSVKRDMQTTVPATPPAPGGTSARNKPDMALAAAAALEFTMEMDLSQDGASVPQTVPNSQESVAAAANGGGGAQEDLNSTVTANMSKKRMADGMVKQPSRSISPEKGHARATSAISMASTASNIGEISADLKTRLAYAMVKVNNGWQSRSLQEVESLASQAASPASSSSTVHRAAGSSASPNLPPTPPPQVHFAPNPVIGHLSKSPPTTTTSRKPMLAPPAPIQPSSNGRINSRRNTNRQYAPALLTHSYSASASQPPHSRNTEATTPQFSSSQPIPNVDGHMYSPHQNVREQDAIETLLFMSSPGNSTNLKHTFSPSVSPGPQDDNMKGLSPRTILSNNIRRTLPGQRPMYPSKKVEFEKSPLMGPPLSPMDLDSPQRQQQQHQQQYQQSSRWTPRTRVKGTTGHLRGALSLPSGLGVGNGKVRPTLRDEDIERMLDHAAADSSDDEEIQLPRRSNGVVKALEV